MKDVAERGPGAELKPRQPSFMIPRVVPVAGVLLVLCAGGGAAAAWLGAPGGAAAATVVFLLGVGFSFYAALVAYRKERYRLLEDRLLCARGGLLSDHEAELEVRNVTHVMLRLPWLRHKLFGIGDVQIQSAGSEGSQIVLRSVREPEEVYARIQRLMRDNGFALGQAELLHEEQPALAGVALECLGIAVGVLIGALGLFGQLIAEAAARGGESLPWLGLLIGVPALAFAFVSLIVHFLDMKRRTYRVYDDVVVYEEGFLTRDNAFIPAENLADSNTKRTLIDQILGLYDVQVSCQGAGQEIKFRRLRRGADLSASIDRLIATFRDRPRPAGVPGAPAPEPAPGGAAGAAAPAAEAVEPGAPTVPPEEAWTASLRMDAFRAVASLFLLLPVVPIWIAAAILAYVRAQATRYEVRPGSVKSSYQLLSTHEREFTYGKVTGVVVQESPLDRWLGTVTVRLWSIGADAPLDLQHVKREALDLPALLRQCGIRGRDVVVEEPARFSFGLAHKANLPGTVLGLLVLAAGVAAGLLVHGASLAAPIALAVAWAAGLLVARARYGRMKLTIRDEHIELQEGIFFRHHYHVRHENVKKVVVTRYPASEAGEVHFAVAGEMILGQQSQSGGGQPKGARVPYGFTARYLPDIDARRVSVDAVLQRKTDRDALEAEAREPVRTGQPAAANTVAILILVSVFVVPLVALLPLTTPLAVAVVRRRSYAIERRRVVYRWGLLYRRQSSILFGRIDSLSCGQGPLNKLFKNGNVTILTAGSSQPDLVLSNLPDYQEAYREIQRHYGR